jgi:hypothetical protein
MGFDDWIQPRPGVLQRDGEMSLDTVGFVEAGPWVVADSGFAGVSCVKERGPAEPGA